MKHLIIFLSLILLVNCTNEKQEVSENSTIEQKDKKSSNEYVDYLKSFELASADGQSNELKIEKIGDQIFWITKIQGAGTIQEYYWINNDNKLLAKYIFEYGGMNWDEPLEYTFISIDQSDTSTGVAKESQIELNKIDFISKTNTK